MNLTVDQRTTMAVAIAKGLKQIGIPINVENIKHFLVPTMRAAAANTLEQYEPPNAYAADLQKLRAGGVKQTTEFRTSHARSDGDYTPPDSYAADIARMRSETR